MVARSHRAIKQHQYHFIDTTGGRGKIHVVAIWRVRDGKIAEVKELKQFEEGQIELQQRGG
jgi:ketosteroid isomerase-like protein